MPRGAARSGSIAKLGRIPGVVGLAIGTRPDCVPDDVSGSVLPNWPARRTCRSSMVCKRFTIGRWVDEPWPRCTLRFSMPSATVAAADSRFVPTSCSGCRANRTPTCWRPAARLPGCDLTPSRSTIFMPLKDTPLADQVAAGQVHLIDRAEYVATLVDFPGIAATDDGRRADQRRCSRPISSLGRLGVWTNRVRAAVEAEFCRRDTWQSKCWSGLATGTSPVPGNGPAHGRPSGLPPPAAEVPRLGLCLGRWTK